MKKYIFIFCLSALTCNIHAQQKTPFIKFSNITSAGLLSGESQNIFTVQTINGIKYKTWFAGLGVAYDTYGYKSIPVFIDIRKTFGDKKWQPFVYADAGVNFSLYSDVLPQKANGIDEYKFYNTFYGETGLGLRRVLSKNTSIILSAGYSYKQFSYLQYNYYSVYPLNILPTTTQFDFYYRRFSVKMGVQF